MGPLLLALALLAPRASAPAIEATGVTRAPQQLAGRPDVQRLCKALEFPERRRDAQLDRAAAEADQEERRARALEGRYAVELAGRGLSFDYDEERRTLTLGERAHLLGAGGALRVWSVDDTELPMAADPALARRITAAARNGEGRLRLLFALPEDDDAAVCAHAPGTHSWGLGVEPVSWAFLVKGEVLARGGAEEPEPVQSQGSARPAVEVGTPPAAQGAALRQALAGHRAALLACYQEGLKERPGLDGALVVELEVPATGGRARSARVALDSLHAPRVARCVLAEVKKAELPGGKAGARVQVPLHFRRDGG
ncbi:MAG: AgmX/PglI C-terminal domain-containing protein [Deltaproteobacteria bacterium]|nr:AgmX/PglI C-terminal domain-containing protein [Deltaproteobacteria bacterium]